MSNKSANPSVEAAIARLASRQYGVVSLAQLTAAGLHRSVVVRRTRKGLLHRIHRGVYAVGHAGLSNEGRWMAVVRFTWRQLVDGASDVAATLRALLG